MSKTRLFTLTGLPYAGKTTLRNELVKRFGFSVVSIDEINTARRVGVNKETPISQDDWNVAYEQAYNKLKEYLSSGRSVIFDGGSLTFKERKTQRQIANEKGIPQILIYVRAPVEEIRARWLKNQETSQRGHVREDDFEKALKMWQAPTSEEKPIIFDLSMDIDSWVKENIE